MAQLTLDSPVEASWHLFVAIGAILIVGSLANAAGIGGGAILVPILQAVVGFSLKDSTAISQALIAAGGLVSVTINVFRRSPLDADAPLIDYNLALPLTPVVLAGVSVGIIANTVFPAWLITVLLLLLIILLVTQSLYKGIILWRAESKAAAYVLALQAADAEADPFPLPGTTSKHGQAPAANLPTAPSSCQGPLTLPVPQSEPVKAQALDMALLPQGESFGNLVNRPAGAPGMRMTRNFVSDLGPRHTDPLAMLAGPLPSRSYTTVRTKAPSATARQLSVSLAARKEWETRIVNRKPGVFNTLLMTGSDETGADVMQPTAMERAHLLSKLRSKTSKRLQSKLSRASVASTHQGAHSRLASPAPSRAGSRAPSMVRGGSPTGGGSPLRGGSPMGGGTPQAGTPVRGGSPEPSHRGFSPSASGSYPHAPASSARLGGDRDRSMGHQAANLLSVSSLNFMRKDIPEEDDAPLSELSVAGMPARGAHVALTGAHQPPVPLSLVSPWQSDALTPHLSAGLHPAAARPAHPWHKDHTNPSFAAAAVATRADGAGPGNVRWSGHIVDIGPDERPREAEEDEEDEEQEEGCVLCSPSVPVLVEVMVEDLKIIPRLTVALMFATWVVFVALQISRALATRCSAGYWALLIVQLVVMIAIGVATAAHLLTGSWQLHKALCGTWFTGSTNSSRNTSETGSIVDAIVLKLDTRQDQPLATACNAAYTSSSTAPAKPPPQSSALGSTSKAVFTTLSVACGAGMLGGLMGMGGGMIISPLLLQLNVDPQVGSATSSIMVFFSSSAAVIGFAMLGRLNLEYCLVLGAVNMVASVLGVGVVAGLVRRTGRTSIVIFTLTTVMVLAFCAVLGFNVTSIGNALTTGEDLGFVPLC